jgi:hypothetical protein
MPPLRLRARVSSGIVLVLVIGAPVIWLVSKSDASDTPNWVPAPAQPGDYTFLDLELSLRARRALREDAALNVPNLGVAVRNRVATLWGEAPSAELARLAENRLRQVLGLTSIRNEMRIKPGADEAKTSSPLQRRPFLAEPVIPEPVRAEEFTVRRPSGRSRAPGQETFWRPRKAASQPAVSPLLGPFVPSFEDRPAANAAESPSPPSWRPRSAQSSELGSPGLSETTPVIPPRKLPDAFAPVAEQAGVDLAGQVEALRGKDQRFEGIRPEIKGGVIYLRGSASRWQDVYDLARSLSLLPGVERVILEDVRTHP